MIKNDISPRLNIDVGPTLYKCYTIVLCLLREDPPPPPSIIYLFTVVSDWQLDMTKNRIKHIVYLYQEEN